MFIILALDVQLRLYRLDGNSSSIDSYMGQIECDREWPGMRIRHIILTIMYMQHFGPCGTHNICVNYQISQVTVAILHKEHLTWLPIKVTK